MSIAEFYIENGIDPSDPNHIDRVCALGRGDDDDDDGRGNEDDDGSNNYDDDYDNNRNADREVSLTLPTPQDDEEWMKICCDNEWRYRHDDEDEDDLYCCDMKNSSEKPIYATTPALLQSDVHRCAFAPRWVFETKPIPVGPDGTENMLAYKRRLVCALTGRFICFTGDSSGEVKNSGGEDRKGGPELNFRYYWRYWDNNGNVYEDYHKFRDEVRVNSIPPTCRVIYGGLPGDFDQPWITMDEGAMDGWGPSGPYSLNVCTFWDTIWNYRYKGTTGYNKWDKCLDALVALTGVPVDNNSNEKEDASATTSPSASQNHEKEWPLDESVLDKTATTKGWKKVPTRQPAMASFRKHDVRLNFYLSTGTVGSCLNHPRQGKTQLFRKKLDDPLCVFDDPRQHTGKGYQQRKDDDDGGNKRKRINDR